MLLLFHTSKESNLADWNNIPVLVTTPVENLIGKKCLKSTPDLKLHFS